MKMKIKNRNASVGGREKDFSDTLKNWKSFKFDVEPHNAIEISVLWGFYAVIKTYFRYHSRSGLRSFIYSLSVSPKIPVTSITLLFLEILVCFPWTLIIGNRQSDVIHRIFLAIWSIEMSDLNSGHNRRRQFKDKRHCSSNVNESRSDLSHY